MKVAVLRYEYSENIGDNIQSVAVAQHLKHVDFRISRDKLNEYSGDHCVVVLNGWFSHAPENWPPSDAITPIFFGFHVAPAAVEAYRRHAVYFKRFEPVGCRDAGTAEILRGWGIDAYVSGCATMTFPARTEPPADGLNLLIDCPAEAFRRRDRWKFWVGTHKIFDVEDDARYAYAAALVRFYRERASTVITSRIHCAMPCAAMGIPVAYLGPKEYRTDVIGMMGIPIIERRKFHAIKLKSVPFFREEFFSRKAAIVQDLRARLSAAGAQLA